MLPSKLREKFKAKVIRPVVDDVLRMGLLISLILIGMVAGMIYRDYQEHRAAREWQNSQYYLILDLYYSQEREIEALKERLDLIERGPAIPFEEVKEIEH